jgi:hypothetical protein
MLLKITWAVQCKPPPDKIIKIAGYYWNGEESILTQVLR